MVKEQVKKNRERQRQAASRGQLPKFVGEDYVIVIRVRRLGSTPKLVSTWTGPWPVITADKVHLYGVRNIVVHVVRLRGKRPRYDGGFKGGVSSSPHTRRV